MQLTMESLIHYSEMRWLLVSNYTQTGIERIMHFAFEMTHFRPHTREVDDGNENKAPFPHKSSISIYLIT